MDIAIFQPIFSFIRCYQFHRRFQPFPLSPLPFLLHRSTPCLSVHLHRRILPSPRFFFFCFTPLRSLQPVLRQPVIPPLFFWLANCAHTRALEHTKRHLCRFPFFSLSSRPRTVARSTVANCEYAHYRYLQTARLLVHPRPGFSRSRFPPESTNRSIHRSASLCRIFLSLLPSHRACSKRVFEERVLL